MIRFALALAVITLFLGTFCGRVQAEEKGADTVTKNGTFLWSKDKKKENHALKAVFTPAGANKWTVVFSCDWKEKPYKYTGTASGDLKNGDVAGEAEDEKKKKKWSFAGTAKDGVLTCSHAEIKGNKKKPSGKFTLK